MEPDNTRGGRRFIAVVGQWRTHSLSLSKIPVPYVNAVAEAGGEPKVLTTFAVESEPDPPPSKVATESEIDPHDASVLQDAVGLLIPGGGDIDPAWYKKKPHPKTRWISHRRDRFELTLLADALARDMPVLGICHGAQLLNVHLGGTLDQHLADRHKSIDHDIGKPQADPVHGLRIEPGTLMEEILGTRRTKVNSHHHQGLGNVAPMLQHVAWSPDSVLEAVVSSEHSWVVGVQWHPEAMAATDPGQARLFTHFVSACDTFARRPDDQARSA